MLREGSEQRVQFRAAPQYKSSVDIRDMLRRNRLSTIEIVVGALAQNFHFVVTQDSRDEHAPFARERIGDLTVSLVRKRLTRLQCTRLIPLQLI